MNGKKLFKIAIEIVIIVILGVVIHDNYYVISNKLEYAYKKYLLPNVKQTLIDNDYRKKENYEFVKINTNVDIKSKEEAKNAIYTFLDAGWDKYIIKCDPDYLMCTTDVKNMIENKAYLTEISNFVHPYNTYNKVNTTISSMGIVTLSKEPRYTDDEIKQINEKIDTIYNANYDSKKSVKENIKTFHDYIINHTKYDKTYKQGSDVVTDSSTAYGVLFKGIGICSGYTDTMQLFLEKMGVRNYRISSETHTWNFVYVNGKWLHLDLTWDDPITSDGSDAISDGYFLITTNDLKAKNDGEHNFDENVYIEAK